MIAFEQPLWLLALLPVVAGVLVLARRGRPPVSRSQHRAAVGMRVAAVVLLVLALAQPLVLRQDSTRSIVYLVDRSESISGTVIADQDAYIAEALESADPGSQAAVAVFGADTKVEAGLTEDPVAGPIRAIVDGSSTDMASAMQSAAALLPTSGSRRIVVLTDSVVTAGDPRLAAQDLAERGIAVDVVEFDTGRGPDALIESIGLPSVVRVGERATAEVVVRSNTAGPASVVVSLGDDVHIVEVDLESGRNVIEATTTVEGEGFLNVTAEVQASLDSHAANNRAQAVSRVIGAASVAVVEGVPGEADQLTTALEAAGMKATEMSVVPTAAELLAFDAVVLVNVALPTPDETERLRAFVEDFGRGLVVVGGDQSFGLGGYEDSPLESLLPVRSNPDDLLRRQPVAEVLVIDTSGSMGACHCGDEDGHTGIEGGINKTDISRAGAGLAIDALTSQDRVGVVSFGATTDWVLPLGPVPSAADAEAALGVLNPAGESTAIARGLEAALTELEGAEESLRHIVLFTDGWDPNEATLIPMAREIAEAGVTLSVLGTGEGSGVTLQRMADIGGGRFYSGESLEDIPEIFVEETLQVARGLAQEGTFVPALGAPSSVTENLTEAPPLGGYVLTNPKTTAQMALLVGEQDPLLATWQRGLGRVTAWTSDATARWAADWIVWDGYVDFWGGIVEGVLPPGRERPPTVEVRGGDLAIGFAVPGAPANSSGLATVRRPNGQTVTVPLTRGPDDTFVGLAPAGAPGTYWVAASVSADGETVATASSGAVSAYSEEFAFRESDATLAPDVAGITGGSVDPAPGDTFAAAERLGRRPTAAWPWLAAMALILFVGDVMLRRLVIFVDAPTDEADRGDAGRTSRRVEFVPPAPEPTTAEPATETLGRLLDRRRR